MKTYSDFCRITTASEIEFEVLVSTFQTKAAIQLCRQRDNIEIYIKRVSKIEHIGAFTLEEAMQKFEKTETFCSFAAQNKGYRLFKFYISPEKRLYRFFDNSAEIIQSYQKYTVNKLKALYNVYQLSSADNLIPPSLFSEYIFYEKHNGLLPPDVKNLEKHIIDNSCQDTQTKYYSLINNDCNTPEKQYEIAEILYLAAHEERDKNRPVSAFEPGNPAAISKAYYSPALSWALKAIDQQYPSAYHFASKLIYLSGKDIKFNKSLILSLRLHAALLGNTSAQISLASEHASKRSSPELPNLVDYNPELAEFWFNLLIEKDDPEAYDSIALFYHRILNKDLRAASSYYQRLVDLGKEEYYGDLISCLIYSEDLDTCHVKLDELLRTEKIEILKKVFKSLLDYDKFIILRKNMKFEIAQRIVQLSDDISYYPYLAEEYHSTGDIPAFKRCIHSILASSNVDAISNAYNVFKKHIFLILNDIELEMEFIDNAKRLGNLKATSLIQNGYKKGIFGNWKHSKDWQNYSL